MAHSWLFYHQKNDVSNIIDNMRSFHTTWRFSGHPLHRSNFPFWPAHIGLPKTLLSKLINTQFLKSRDKQSELCRMLDSALKITNDIELSSKTLPHTVRRPFRRRFNSWIANNRAYFVKSTSKFSCSYSKCAADSKTSVSDKNTSAKNVQYLKCKSEFQWWL